MRLFQNSGLYPAYVPRLRRLTAHDASFDERMRAFLADRFGAPHFLQPVLDHDPAAFFTNGDDEQTQRLWARQQGLPADASLEAILLGQIEAHRTEVFYNLDPVRYASDFVRRLPGSVRRRIAWRAAPSPGADLSAYDAVVCNFPSILLGYAQAGWRTAYFAPGHDPVMDGFAAEIDRPIDVLFVGAFTRHHRRRAALLEAIAGLGSEFAVALHLDRSRATRFAESPLGRMFPLAAHRRPAAIHTASREPIFGTDLYRALGCAKIVINGAIDMAGNDRGNMRCFEALGCGSLLLSDAGEYPEGMRDGETLCTYSSPDDAVSSLRDLLGSTARRQHIAGQGHAMVRTLYSKQAQWSRFLAIAQ